MGSAQSMNKYTNLSSTGSCCMIRHEKPCIINRPTLTQEQIRLVTDSWTVIKRDIAKIGIVIFLRLFETHPDVQQLFIHFRGLTSKQLRKSKPLREHGLKVLSTLDKCIARIDQLEHLVPLLHDLGKLHSSHHIKMHYLSFMVSQMEELLLPMLGDQCTVQVQEAWTSCLNYLIHIMSEGMYT